MNKPKSLMPMLFRVLALGLAIPLSATATLAPAIAQTPSRAERAVLEAEDARFAAQVRKDVAAVSQLMADDLIYTHAVGRVQTKAEFLQDLGASRANYRSITAADRTVRVSGDLAVTHATLTNVLADRTLKGSYVGVYVRRSGRWQLYRWQTSPEFNAAAMRSGPPANPTPGQLITPPAQ